MPRITQPVGSISQAFRPWKAERGNVWWLWCQDSPIESGASQKTLVEWSSTANRRGPKKWETEVADRVDRPRPVVGQEDPDRPAPQRRLERPPRRAGDQEAQRRRDGDPRGHP